MNRLTAIVDRRSSRECCELPAGFVHQKIGCRKVPVVAVAARKCDVQGALRDTGEPQRK